MLAFTAEELAARFRSDVDDKITDVNGSDADCLWSNADVYGYMTAAVDALARATDGLFRTVRLPVAAGVATVYAPVTMLHIREVRLASTGDELHQLNANDVDLTHLATGRPRAYVRDLERKALWLTPIPVQADVLEVFCTVTCGAPMAPGFPLPFLETVDQLLLLEYMKSLAYRKHDAETEDLTRARDHERRWQTGADDRKSELNNYRRHPPVMRMAY